MTLGIRPEQVRLVAPGAGLADLDVVYLEPLGSETLVHARRGEVEVGALTPLGTAPPADTPVGIQFDGEAIHLFERESGRRIERAS